MADFYQLEAKLINGDSWAMQRYEGQVLLVVNLATECRLSPQLRELASLYNKYHDSGLAILGFPCNQFAHQEPRSNAEIEIHCSQHYGVRFPLFEKIEVNGQHTHPIYQYLKKARKGFLFTERVKWNYTKFLLDREGRVISRYAPTTHPKKLEYAIKNLLDS
jgi:glutathione peroxidase